MESISAEPEAPMVSEVILIASSRSFRKTGSSEVRVGPKKRAPHPRSTLGLSRTPAKGEQGGQAKDAREGARCRAGGGSRARRAGRGLRPPRTGSARRRVALSGLSPEMRAVRLTRRAAALAGPRLRDDAPGGRGHDAARVVSRARRPHSARAVGADAQSLHARTDRTTSRTCSASLGGRSDGSSSGSVPRARRRGRR
jgi:hypothetical protein